MIFPNCECGCGEKVSKFGNKFIYGHNRRGIMPSEETKLKLSKSNVGQKRSDEARAKMSKGQKGREFSDEHRAKISKGNLDKKVSEEARKKISKSHMGIRPSDETKLKISKANLGKKRTQKAIANMSKAHKGKKLSDETKFKIGLANLKTEPREYCHAWYDKEYVDDCRKPACEKCGLTNILSLQIFGCQLHTHHLNGKKACAPEDIQTLCKSCHMRLPRRQKERMKKFGFNKLKRRKLRVRETLYK